MHNTSPLPTPGQQQQEQQHREQYQRHQYRHHNRQQQQQHHHQLLTGTSPSYGLLQNARRRLQCSQTPVRSASCRQQTDSKLASSLRKFPVLGTPRNSNRRSNDISARKSLSMVDLSPGRTDAPTSESCSEGCKASSRLGDGDDNCSEGSLGLTLENSALMRWTRETRAASVICRALVINSWRRRREEVIQLRANFSVIDQNLEHFKIQIVVLRRLLDNENGRVAKLAGELHRAKTHNDDVVKERDQLKMEKETLEGEVQKQQKIAEDRLVNTENLRNGLRSLQDQVNTLDKQIERDREKLLKLTEDKKVLLEKVSTSEALAMERGERAHKAELSLEEMQMQLATQIALTNSLQEKVHQCLNDLKQKEDQKSKLEKMLEKLEEENITIKWNLQSREEMEFKLNSRTVDLENQVLEQKLKIDEFESTCNAQVLELKELRERIERQTEENGWSSKVFQFAGSFTRMPRVILRTLSFFTTGMSIIL